MAGYRLHDLTRPMTRDTIVALAGKLADGDERYAVIEKDPLRSWETENGAIFHVHMQDHFGTHVDAPIHTVRDAPCIDQVDFGRFFGEALRGRRVGAHAEGARAGALRGDRAPTSARATSC